MGEIREVPFLGWSRRWALRWATLGLPVHVLEGTTVSDQRSAFPI